MSGMSERADDFERVAPQNPDLLIGAVVDDEKVLRRIDGKREIPYRTAAKRALRDERFLDERAVLAEDLEAIVRAIADVHQSVVCDAYRMHDAELRRRRAIRIVLAGLVFVLHGAAERARQFFARLREITVVGTFAVGT